MFLAKSAAKKENKSTIKRNTNIDAHNYVTTTLNRGNQTNAVGRNKSLYT